MQWLGSVEDSFANDIQRIPRFDADERCGRRGGSVVDSQDDAATVCVGEAHRGVCENLQRLLDRLRRALEVDLLRFEGVSWGSAAKVIQQRVEVGKTAGLES